MLTRSQLGCDGESNAGNTGAFRTVYLAAMLDNGDGTRRFRSKPARFVAPCIYRPPTLIGCRKVQAGQPGFRCYSPALALPSAGSMRAALATLAASASVASFFALSPLPGWISPADMMSLAAASTGMSSSMTALRDT
jgi:hypothetical protein